jgi:hypothetical protein
VLGELAQVIADQRRGLVDPVGQHRRRRWSLHPQHADQPQAQRMRKAAHRARIVELEHLTVSHTRLRS